MSKPVTMLRVMPREMRMMSERILSLTALPKGFAMMMQDNIMYSEAMGLGGFALLEQRLEAIKSADPRRITLIEEMPGQIALDAGGQHGWFAAPVALDLLGAALMNADAAQVNVTNATDPAELAIAEGLGPRHGLRVTLRGTVLGARKAAPADPMLRALLDDGCPIPADLWWRIWALAQTALTPDSAVSRRHAGPVIVTEDGKMIGRTDNDDDTDVSFISSGGSLPAGTTSEGAEH